MNQELESIGKEVRQIMANISAGETRNNRILASIHDRLDNLVEVLDKSQSLLRSHFVSFYEAVDNYDSNPSSPALQYVDQMAKPMLVEVKRLTAEVQ
ncbi:MAG: hypothetical protein P0S95_03265 [Rhabdochlamydiaceae bacterium]|nr:hypothetical protein [Candidatus Amphrikana amoebophyrae]